MAPRRWLHVLGRVLLGGALSLVAGLAVVFASTRVVPCIGEQLGCNIGEAIGLVAVLGFVPIVALVLGLTAYFSTTRGPLALAALLVCLPLVSGFLILAPGRIALLKNLPEFVARDIQALVQSLLPLFVVALVQWRVLRRSVPADSAGAGGA
jgi:hypothetical protein